MKRIVLSVAIMVLFIAGCSNPSKTQVESGLSVENEISEPDSYFADAINHFNEGDLEAASESIEDGIFFIRTTGAVEDTLHADMLGFAIEELESLKADLDETNVQDASKLLTVFSSVDRTLASYHLSIVETYFWDGSDSGEGLRRLEDALERITYAAKYKAYPLTEEQQDLINGLIITLQEEDQSSPDTWKRTNSIVKKISKGLKGLQKKKVAETPDENETD